VTAPQWPAPGPEATAQQLLDALEDYLAELPPIQRALATKALADSDTVARWGAVRRAAIHQATEPRGATYATVAEALGVSEAAVNKAVSEHRKALTAQAGAKEGTTK
jgi:DNA-directed RNA polymerase specialized sigma24 family protein